MSHDFANSKKKKKKTVNASGGLPSWFWLFTGIVSGLFIAFLIYLSGVTAEPTSPANNNEAEPELTKMIKEQAERLREGKEAIKKPRFEFYDSLPELKVETPKRKESPIPANKTKAYILQAGSFKSFQDADSLKAQLIMQGLDVKIKSVKGEGGQSWHRVHVGPYYSQNSLNKAQDALANSDIESMLLEIK